MFGGVLASAERAQKPQEYLEHAHTLPRGPSVRAQDRSMGVLLHCQLKGFSGSSIDVGGFCTLWGVCWGGEGGWIVPAEELAAPEQCSLHWLCL